MFDEPLTVIDPHLKWQLRSKLKELHQRIGRTMIYVTHDQTEALTFADKVVVMHEGTVVQIGSPVELFERPRHTFVGHFIGSPGMNVLPCEVRRAAPSCSAGDAVAVQNPPAAPLDGKRLEIGVRPEFVSFARRRPAGRASCKVSDAGRYRIVEARHGDEPHQAAGRRRRRRAGRRRARALRSGPHAALRRRLAGGVSAMNAKTENQKGWLLRPAGRRAGRVQRRHPADGGGELFGAGDLRQQRVLLRGREVVRAGAALGALPRLAAAPARLHAASSWRSRCRSASRSRSPCRARGPWVSVCLVLMALPLLIPWNVVGAMWNIFALPDIGMLGRTLNRLGIELQLHPAAALRLGDADRHGRLALDLAGGAARLCGPERDSRTPTTRPPRSTARPPGRCSATSSCRR